MDQDKHIQNMRGVYNKIAHEFSDTRKYAWQEWQLFKPYIAKTGKILDVGCGNGRLSEQFPKHEYYGIDLADEFIKIAQKKYPQRKFEQAEMTSLPYEDSFFDDVFSIAALHHLPNPALRLQALKEMHRVLKPGGHLFIMVWNLRNNPRYQKELDEARDQKREFDLLIPWGDNQIMRYYYAYSDTELKQQLNEAGFNLVETHIDRNISCIAQKS